MRTPLFRFLANLTAVVANGLTALLAGALLIGRGGGRIDLLTSLTPVFLVGAIVAWPLGWLVQGRSRRIAVGLGALAILGYGLIVGPELIAAATQPRVAPAAGRTLRIFDHNVWAENRDLEATARTINESGADIVLLQELGWNSPRMNALLRAKYPYVANCGTNCQEEVLSRYPLQSGERLVRLMPGLRSGGFLMIWALVTPPGQPPFVVATTHFDHPDPGSSQGRQTANAAAFLRQFDPASTILAGDFNLTPWSPRIRQQEVAFGLIRRTFSLATWPARWPRFAPFPMPILAIDHLYAGSDWKVVSIRRGPRTGSDHYPVIIDLVR